MLIVVPENRTSAEHGDVGAQNRLTRDLVTAEARRHMAQWRRAKAINEDDPEMPRIIAASRAAQMNDVDATVKSNADADVLSDRLQFRLLPLQYYERWRIGLRGHSVQAGGQ